MVEIAWADERWGLLPQRAMYRRSVRTLYIADPHFGKPASFRAAGIPVPGGTTGRGLARLDSAIDATGAARLVILGDLLHGPAGRTAGLDEQFRAWRAGRSSLEIVLVRGNHDRTAGDPPAAWGVDCVDEPCDDAGVTLCHDLAILGDAGGRESSPGFPRGRAAIGGHVHPAVGVASGDGFRRRLPCFVLGAARGLLPAFGSFTGTHVIRPGRSDRVFAPDDDAVYEVTRLVSPAPRPRMRASG